MEPRMKRVQSSAAAMNSHSASDSTPPRGKHQARAAIEMAFCIARHVQLACAMPDATVINSSHGSKQEHLLARMPMAGGQMDGVKNLSWFLTGLKGAAGCAK